MTASKVARRLTLHQPQLRDRHTDLDAAAAMIVLVLVLDLDAVVPPASTDADHWLLDTLHDQYHSQRSVCGVSRVCRCQHVSVQVAGSAPRYARCAPAPHADAPRALGAGRYRALALCHDLARALRVAPEYTHSLTLCLATSGRRESGAVRWRGHSPPASCVPERARTEMEAADRRPPLSHRCAAHDGCVERRDIDIAGFI